MKVSIVTTAYNIEDFIENCIKSLLSQTYKNIEIILVNDCSTDKTIDIINTFDDERILILNHEYNMGAGWARRHGIEAASGEYVITVDGDDWISPTFIEDLVQNAKETDADIVSGGITIVVNEEYEEIKRFVPRISSGIKKFQDYNDGKIIFLNNKLVKRKLYSIVPYSTRRFCEDTPVILPLLYYSNKVSYVDNQGYFYRQHQNSLCHRVDNFEQALFKALCGKDMMNFFQDKGEEYQSLISKKEFLGYLQIIHSKGNPSLYNKFNKELGELAPNLLEYIFGKKDSLKENSNNFTKPEDILQKRLELAIQEAQKYGFNKGTVNPNKLVHVIWLGGASFPNVVTKCMESWKQFIGDRTLCFWTEISLDLSHPWVQETYKQRKYAFSSDYLRLWCIYNFGGIYLDVDVELVKPLDVCENFFALESCTNSVALGLSFGAIRNNPIIGDLLTIYDRITFDISDGYSQVQPRIITQIFVDNGWEYKDKIHSFKGFTIYPTEVFCPKNMVTNEITLTENTIGIHHYLGSWG